MKMEKKRLDILLVEKRLVETSEKGRRLILAGLVEVKGLSTPPKAGMRLSQDAEILVHEPLEKYVSRGGIKLAHALNHFHIQPRGCTCLDLGASTGGFTDCLLQRGARSVYAVDVGYGQIDYRLRQDPRVILLECVNARYLSTSEVPEPVDLVVIDVSFISVRLVLKPLANLLQRKGSVVALIKPQFEAGREKIPRGGVVKDKRVHEEVLERVLEEFIKDGWKILGLEPSPIPGMSGNREYFAHLCRPSSGLDSLFSGNNISEIVSKAFQQSPEGL
jgi:23S rRNA (cytidine1920-2'-O)/16S rRNA (cytidine1409-2'-O)-methyltransferase